MSVRVVKEILEEGLRNFLNVIENELDLALSLDIWVAPEGAMHHLIFADHESNFRGLQGPLPVEGMEDDLMVEDCAQESVLCLKPFIGKSTTG